jgi:phosphoglucomutase
VQILHDLGLEVLTVPEQSEPDGNFPTVKSPNPEEASALKMALLLGEKENASLVMATDPDADRLGIAVPEMGEKKGKFRLITGNQLGALLSDYIFGQLVKEGKLPEKPAFVKTIVTTELQACIAEKHGAEVFNVLTGFKYIAEKIKDFEKSGHTYIFGGEESYGYLVGTEVRDKDAVSAAVMTAEMTLYHFSKGKSLIERLEELYLQYGFFEELLISKKFEGEKGKEKISEIMKELRGNRPDFFGGQKITGVKDYLAGVSVELTTGQEYPIHLPKSNVLQFLLNDGSIVSARPSGTEPKIKFYASSPDEPGKEVEQAKREVRVKIDRIREDIENLFS